MNWKELEPLRDALREFRVENHYNQDDLAERLAISRKTYLLFETCRWLPPKRERGHFVKLLHELDPALAQLLVGILGGTLEDHVLVRSSVVTAPVVALGAAEAKRVFDVAVYETAEELDISPQTLRPIVATVIGKLASSEISLAQAAALAKAAQGARKKASA